MGLNYLAVKEREEDIKLWSKVEEILNIIFYTFLCFGCKIWKKGSRPWTAVFKSSKSCFLIAYPKGIPILFFFFYSYHLVKRYQIIFVCIMLSHCSDYSFKKFSKATTTTKNRGGGGGGGIKISYVQTVPNHWRLLIIDDKSLPHKQRRRSFTQLLIFRASLPLDD